MLARTLRLGFALLTLSSAAAAAPFQDEYLDDLDALLEGGDIAVSGEAEPSILRDWKGFVELEPRVFLRDRGGENNDEELVFLSEFEFDFRFREDLSGYFRPRIYVDALDEERDRFEPFEAYVTWEGDDWDLRGGQFVENWGIADTYNPIDVINRRDLGVDPLDPDRLGERGLRMRKLFEGGDTVGEPTISLYALPVFQTTTFGTENQRLGPGTNALPFDESGGFEPSGSESGFYAGRFQSTINTPLASADLQLLASSGPSRTPTFALDTAGTLVPAYYGASTVGVGLRAVPNEEQSGDFLSTLTLKAEVTYTDAYGLDHGAVETPDDYLSYVLGVDRSFFHFLSDQDEVTLTVEYAGESGASDPSTILRPFGDDLILRAAYEANDFSRTSLELRALIDLGIDENIFELIYQRQLRSISEDLRFSMGLQVFDTGQPGESFYGSVDNLTSLVASLRWDI